MGVVWDAGVYRISTGGICRASAAHPSALADLQGRNRHEQRGTMPSDRAQGAAAVQGGEPPATAPTCRSRRLLSAYAPVALLCDMNTSDHWNK